MKILYLKVIYKSELHILKILIQYEGFSSSLNILIMNYYIYLSHLLIK